MPRIISIFAYPIKSCGGVRLKEAEVTLSGLRFDRQYMIVDDSGDFISQRKAPKLALVHTEIHGKTVLFRASKMPEMAIQYGHHTNKQRTVSVHGLTFTAFELEGVFTNWMSDYLSMSCTLVTIEDRHPRVREISGRAMHVNCHDSSSVTVLSEESVWDLTSRLRNNQSPDNIHRNSNMLDVTRFRPNIFVQASGHYGEESWKQMTTGEDSLVTLAVRKRTERCPMIDINPETGEKEKGGAILRELCQYKLFEGKPTFGMSYFVRSLGRIRVGDELEVA